MNAAVTVSVALPTLGEAPPGTPRPAWGNSRGTEPLSLAEIDATLFAITGRWPRREGRGPILHVPDGAGSTHILASPSGLFGYCHEVATVTWLSGAAFVTKAEYYAHLERTAPPLE